MKGKDCRRPKRRRKDSEIPRSNRREREFLKTLGFVLSTSGEGLIIVTPQYRIRYQSGLLKDRYGDLIGKKCHSALLGVEKPCRQCPLRRKGNNGKLLRAEFKGGDGSEYQLASIPLEYPNGCIEVLEVIRDVSEIKTVETRLSALNLYGRKLNNANSCEQVYELTLDAMEQTLGFAHAAFMIVDRGNLRVASQRGYPRPLLVVLPLNRSKKGITVKAATTKRSILVPDTAKDKDYVEGISGIRSELAVPIKTEAELLGVLNVESKKPSAFNQKDLTLLQVLASHAATALSNIEKRQEIEKRSSQLALLMKSSIRIISSADLHQRLETIAEAIRELGWRRVVISVRNQDMDVASPEDIVTAGLNAEDIEFLWKNRTPGKVWRERFGPEYEHFKVGEFYHLPWSDPWVRKRFSDSTVPSKVRPEEMVDWDPQDLLYAPLRLADGSIVGVLSIDDPTDGKRPTKASLLPLELFIPQAAVAIENAQLIHSLNAAREQLKADAELLESKVQERTLELQESQMELLKAQRLAAMGELARMVGHDLRNPLTGIAGATYYLKSKLGPKMASKALQMLELIEKDIEYSNKIVNDLLEYSGELQLSVAKTKLRPLIEAAKSMVEVPASIEVEDSTKSLLMVAVDIEKMKRVFANIIRNAVDAMTTGGKLTIKTKKLKDNVEITFVDTGTGMSGDIIEKIWRPLFTTKAKGMGLGLSICKRVVEAHGGSIHVKSRVGEGTEFTVSIPAKPRLEGGENIWVQMPESLLSTTKRA